MQEAQKVFIVDDDPDMRASVGRSLSIRGFDVEGFKSAEDFLSAFGNGRPGCLVLDFGLPGMNGLELQEYLIDNGIKVPIIFITGHGGIPESVKATKAGAVDFLEKPYRPDILTSRVEAALELDRLERKSQALRAGMTASLDQLSDREREVFELILEKPEMSSSKGIALALDISPRTVDKHRAQILLKTECRTVAELIGRYGKKG